MQKHALSLLLGVFIISVMTTACDNSFDPKSEFEEKLVVYGIISKSQEKQVIRLESTYDADLTDPDTPLTHRIITDATVFVNDGKDTYKFIKEDATNPDSPVPYLWTNSEMVPVEGRIYSMRVVMDGVTVATSQMQLPSRPFLEVELANSTDSTQAGIRVGIGRISTVATPKGYLFRLYLSGIGPGGEELRREVPYAFNPASGDNGEYVYPSPNRATALVFPVNYIKQLKDELISEEGATDFTLTGIGYSMDTHFYNYYKVVRGFDDPVSVRQDNPNITNIDGGLGVFGGMTVDTLAKPYLNVIR